MAQDSDNIHRRKHIIIFDFERPADRFVIFIFKMVEVMIDDIDDKGGVDTEVARLDKQAFAKVSGCNADWIKGVDYFEQAFDMLDRHPCGGSKVIQRKHPDTRLYSGSR